MEVIWHGGRCSGRGGSGGLVVWGARVPASRLCQNSRDAQPRAVRGQPGGFRNPWMARERPPDSPGRRPLRGRHLSRRDLPGRGRWLLGRGGNQRKSGNRALTGDAGDFVIRFHQSALDPHRELVAPHHDPTRPQVALPSPSRLKPGSRPWQPLRAGSKKVAKGEPIRRKTNRINQRQKRELSGFVSKLQKINILV